MPDTTSNNLNRYRLATEDDDQVLRAMKTSEQLYKLSQQELKERMEAGESTAQTLGRQFAEGMVRPGISAGLRGLQAAGVDTNKLRDYMPPGLPADPDEYNRLDQVRQQAVNQSGIYPEGFAGDLAKGAMSAAQQVPGMIGTAAAGGLLGGPIGAFGAMTGSFSAQAWNDAYTEAIDQGFDEARATEYANTAAMVEGVITTAFQATGLGGVEKSLAEAVRGGARSKLRQTIMQKAYGSAKTFGKSLSQEELEEITIESLNNVARSAQGVDPEATDMERMVETAVDTAIQTFWTQVFVGGGQQAARGFEDLTRGIDQKAKDKEAEIPAELEQQIDEALEEGDQTQDGDTRPDDGEGVVPNVATAEGIEQEYQNQLAMLEQLKQKMLESGMDPGMVEDRAAVLQQRIEDWKKDQLERLAAGESVAEEPQAETPEVQPEAPAQQPEAPAQQPEAPEGEAPSVPDPTAVDPAAEPAPTAEEIAGTIDEALTEDESATDEADAPVEPTQEEVNDQYSTVEDKEFLEQRLQEALDAQEMARNILQDPEALESETELATNMLRDSTRDAEAIRARLVELGEGLPEDEMSELELLAQELQTAADQIESAESPVDNQAEEVGLQRLTWDADRLNDETGEFDTQIGQSNSVNIGGNSVVLMDINGVSVPFVQPKDSVEFPDVEAGKWYPFFGITEGGRIIEGNSRQINDYYGMPVLREAAEKLDATVGDIRGERSPAVNPTGVIADELNDGLGLDETRPSTSDEKSSRIKGVLERLNTQPAEAQTQEDTPEAATPEVEGVAAEQQVEEPEQQAEQVEQPQEPELVQEEQQETRSPEDIIDSYATKTGFASEAAKNEGRQQAVQNFVNDGTLPSRQSKYDEDFTAEDAANELSDGRFAENRDKVMEDFVRDGSLPKYGLDNLGQEELRGALQEIAQDDELRGALQEIADRDGIKPEEKKTLGQAVDEQPQDEPSVEDRELLDREAARQEGKKTLGEKPVIAPLRSWSYGKDGSYSIALTETDNGKFRVTETQSGREPRSLDFDTREEADLEYSKSRKAAVDSKTRAALQKDDAEVALVRGSDGMATESSLKLAVDRHFEGKNPWQKGEPLDRTARASLIGLETEPLIYHAQTKLSQLYQEQEGLSSEDAMSKARGVVEPWAKLYLDSRQRQERIRQRYLTETQVARAEGDMDVLRNVSSLQTSIRMPMLNLINGVENRQKKGKLGENAANRIKDSLELLEEGPDSSVIEDAKYRIPEREMGMQTDPGSAKGKWGSTRGTQTESISTTEGSVDVTSKLEMFGTMPIRWAASATAPDGRESVTFGNTRAEAIEKVSAEVSTKRQVADDRKNKVYTKQELDELANLPSKNTRKRELRYIAAAREIAGAETLRYKTLVEKILQQQEDAVPDQPTPELPSQSLETNGTIKEFSVELEAEGETWNATVQFTDTMQGIKADVAKEKQDSNMEMEASDDFIGPFKRWTHSVHFKPDNEGREGVLHDDAFIFFDGFPSMKDMLSSLQYAIRDKRGDLEQFQNADGSITGVVELDAALEGVVYVEDGVQDWDRFDGAEISLPIASFKLTPEAKETTEPDAPTPDSEDQADAALPETPTVSTSFAAESAAEDRAGRVERASSEYLVAAVDREAKKNPPVKQADYQRVTDSKVRVLLSNEQAEDAAATQTEQHGKATVYPELGLFISDQTDKDGVKDGSNKSVTHIATGIQLIELPSKQANLFIRMMSVLGIKADPDPAKLSDDLKALYYVFSEVGENYYGNLQRREDAGKFSLMDKVNELAKPRPARSQADLVLGRAELEYDAPRTDEGKRGIKVIADLLQQDTEVIEFGFNPVFVVTNRGKLKYQNGFTFTFNPEIFLIGEDELKPGMLVAINLPDIGKEYKTARQVVKEYLAKWNQKNPEYSVSLKTPNKSNKIYGVEVSKPEAKVSYEEYLAKKAKAKELGLPAGLQDVAANARVSEVRPSKKEGFKYTLFMNERYSLEGGKYHGDFNSVKEVKDAVKNSIDSQSVTIEVREDQEGDSPVKVSDEDRWSFTEKGTEFTELGSEVAEALNGINWTQPGQKEAEERLAKAKEEAKEAEESVKEEQSTSGLKLPSRMPELREKLAGMADDAARLDYLTKVLALTRESKNAYTKLADNVRKWGINANPIYKPETIARSILSRVKEHSGMLPHIRSAFEYVAQHVDSLTARSKYQFGEAPEALERISTEAFDRLRSSLPNVGGHLLAPLATWGAVNLEEYLRPVMGNTYTPQEVDSLFDGLDSKVRLEGGRKAKPKSFSNEEKIADEIAKRTISFDQYALDNEGQTFLNLEGEDSESLREGLIHQSNQVLVARERKEKRDQLRKDIIAALDTEPVVTDLQSLGKIDSNKFSDDDKAQFADVLATALANLTYDDLLRAIQDTEGESESDTGERYDATGWIIDFLGDLFRDGETDALEELLGTSYRPINRRRTVLDLLNQVIPRNENYSKFPEAQKIVFGHFQEAAAIATNIRKQQKQRLKRELKKTKGRSVKDIIQDTQSQNEELARQFKQLLKKSMFGVGVHTEAQVIAAKLAAGILKEYSLKGIDKLMTFSQYVARASELLGVDTTLKMSKYLERAWDTAKAVVQAGDEMEKSRSIKMVLDGPIHPELDFAEEAEVVYGITDYTNAESPDSFAVSGNQRDVADIKQRAKDGRATGVSVLSVKRRTRKDQTDQEKIVTPLETVRKALIEHVNVHGLPVFLDSGMFGIVQQGEVGQEPDYDAVIEYYHEFLAEIDKDKMHLVSVVAPDFLTKIETPEGQMVIGDAVKTQELQDKYRDDLLFFIGSFENADGEKVGYGANVIVPVQRKFNADGSPDTSYTFEQGSPFGDLDLPFSPNIILGIPANAAKWTNEEIVAGAKSLTKSMDWGNNRLRLHLLGRGPQKGKELAKALNKVDPTIELMGDATTESNKINAGKYRPDGLSVETIDLDKSEFDNVQDAITDGLLDGKNMANASKLREAISNFLGEQKPKAKEAKRIQQYDGIIERAVAAAAQTIMERSLDDQKVYDDLVELHQRTPASQKAKDNQQAEMPAPVAFLAQKELGLGARDRVYDPLARSGMLVAGLDNAILNEPSTVRAEGLMDDGHTVTNEDAQSHEPRQKYNAVIVNANGKRGRNAAVQALAGMPDNGKAVIVLDGAADQSLSARERAAFYRDDAEFFDTLYDGYAVTDHYVLDAGLFDGTAKPVARQVIVIDGKQATDQDTADVKQSIKLPYNRSSGVATKNHIKSWEELGNERLGLQRDAASDDGRQDGDTATATGQNTQPDGSAGTTEGQDGLASGQESDDAGTVRGGVGQQDGGVSADDQAAGRPDGDDGVSGDTGTDDRGADVSPDSPTGGKRGGGVPGDTASESETPGGRDDSVDTPSLDELGDFIGGVLDGVSDDISGEPSSDDLENLGSEIIEAADQVATPGESPVSDDAKPQKPKDTTGVRPPKQDEKPKGDKTRDQLEQEMKDLFDDFGDTLGGTSLGMSGGQAGIIAGKIVLKAIELKIFDFKEAVKKWLDLGVSSDQLVAMGAYIEKAWNAVQQKYKKQFPQMTTARPIQHVLDEITRETKAEGDTKTDEETKAPKPERKPVQFDETTEFQVPYLAKSAMDVPSVGTLVPRNQQAAVQRNLDAVEAKYGNLVDFVAKELGYDPSELREENKNGETIFSAEQIDAIALAIASHKDGYAFVNGDMTGVGKGRFAAAMMIYAAQQGKRPVFVTEKVDLFSDIMRDLTDIMRNEPDAAFEPWITTAVSGENAVDLHSAVEHRYRKRLSSQAAARHAGNKRKLKAAFPDDATSWMEVESDLNEGEQLGRDSKGYYVTADRIHTQSAQNAKKIAGAIIESIRNGDGITVTAEQKKKMKMADSQIGTNYDAIFTTYTQLQTVKQDESWRHDFFREVAEDAFFIMDESHNAAGKQDGRTESDEGKLLRSDFALELLGIAAKKDGAQSVFASATFSKTPATMALYALTGISEGIPEDGSLLDVLKRGGVPLQQALSEMMAESGRYIRRERSFAGIEFEHPMIPIDIKQMNEVSSALQQMNKLNAEAAKQIRENLDRNARAALGRLQNVSGILWNIVNQVLFAAKAPGVAKLAIEAIERGEKPFIAVSNTLGASLEKHLEDLPSDERPDIGDPMEYDMRSLFRTYLDRCITMVNKVDPNDESTWIYTTLSEEEIGESAMEMYAGIREMIDNMPDTMSASPIDLIRRDIEAAGHSIREITGRKQVINYQPDGTAVLGERPSEERGSKGKIASVKAYNDGEANCLIGNVSAAVGLSAHASKKFKNTDRRVMFVAMPIPEINAFMQMLGRINRTGQLEQKEGMPKGSNLPKFFMTVSQSPTEQRIASNQARKLASLNANVTASDETDVKADELDVFNAIGNRIMAQYCIDEAEEAEAKYGDAAFSLCGLCNVAVPEAAHSAPPNFMHKITGRLILVPFARQKAFWQHVDAEFRAAIETLNQVDSNPLKAAFKDFRAKVLESWDIFEGDESGTAFQRPAQLQKMEVEKKLSLLTPKQIQAEIDNGFAADDPKKDRDTKRKNMLDDLAAQVSQLAKQINEDESIAPERKTQLANELLTRNRIIRDTANLITPGTTVTVRVAREDAKFKSMTGVVMRLQHKSTSKDPTKLSDYQLVIAVDNELKRVSIPFSQMQRESVSRVDVLKSSKSLKDVLKHFEDESVATKEVRYIGTGNILAAFEDLNKGSIVFFTDEDGQVQRGVLMPRDFTPEKWQADKPTVFKNAKDVLKFTELGGTAKSPDSHMRLNIDPRGALEIRATASRVAAKYYEGDKAKALEKAAGAKWEKNRGRMRLVVKDKAKRQAAVDHILKEMTKLQTAFKRDRDIARDAGFASQGKLHASRQAPTKEFSKLAEETKTLGSKSSGASSNVRASVKGEMDDNPRDTSGRGIGKRKFRANLEKLAKLKLPKNALISPQAFRNVLGRIFDVDISTGNYWGLRGAVQGLFVIREQFVKMNGRYAFENGVLMHEVAHHIDETLGLMATLPPNVEMEMVQFDYDPKQLRNFEGFAEFIRMYVTLHNVPNKNPGRFPRMLTPGYQTLVDWLENDFASMHPDMFDRIKFAQEVAHRHMDQTPMERAHLAIVEDVEGYLDEYAASQEKRFGMRRMKWKTRWLNAFAATKLLQDEVERRGGNYSDTLSANEYLEGTARSSISNAERAIRDGVWRIDKNGFNEQISEGIMDGLKEFSSGEYRKFGAYLHAKMTLFNPDHQTGIGVEDAHKVIEEISANAELLAKCERMRETLANFNNALIEMAMHANYYSQKEYDDMMKAYGGDGMEYVPLIRVKVGKKAFGKMKSGTSLLARGGGRTEVPRAVYHRTTRGSMDPIIHPVLATLQRAERIYDAANQTQALGLLIQDSEAVPGLGFLVQKNKAGTNLTQARLEEILDQLVKLNVITARRKAAIVIAHKMRLGMPVTDKERAEMRSAFGVSTDKAALAVIPSMTALIDIYRNTWPKDYEGEKFVKYVRDGKIEYYKVHETIQTALKSMSSLERHAVMRTINIFTRMLKAGATSLSTGFGLRQLFMDAGTVAIQGRDVGGGKFAEGVLPVKTTANVIKQLGVSALRMSENEMVQIYKQHGGALVHALNTDELSMRKYLDSGLRRGFGEKVKSGITESFAHPFDAGLRNIGRGVSKVTDAMAATVSWTDIAPRMIEFEAVLNNHGYKLGKGGKIVFADNGRETMPPRHVLLRAVNAAMDVTYNYRRMGTWTAQVEPLFPFLNAAIQSGVKMTKTIGGLVVPEVLARWVDARVNGGAGSSPFSGMEPITAQQARLEGKRYSPTKHRARVAAAVAAQLGALTLIALADAMRDDDDDEEEQSWGKYRGLTLGSKGKEYLTIPHARDYAVFYGAAEIAMDKAYFKPDTKMDEIGGELFNLLSEDLSMRLPQIVSGTTGVVKGLMSNQDPFFGTPIDNPYDIAGNVPRHLRATARSSYLGRGFSETTARINQHFSPTGQGWLSPNQFDFAMDELFGGLYSRVFKDLPSDATTISALYQDEQLTTLDGASKVASSLPFFRGVFRDRLHRKSIGELYDKRNEYEQLHKQDQDSGRGFVTTDSTKWKEMLFEEKVYRQFNDEYVTLMTDLSQAAKEEPDEREREKGARIMIGLARAGLGKKPLPSFVSPYNLPKNQWPAYLLKQRTGGTGAKERSVYDEMEQMIATQLKTAQGAGRKSQEGKEDTLPERTEAAKRWLSIHKNSTAVRKVQEGRTDFKTIREGGYGKQKKKFVWPR